MKKSELARACKVAPPTVTDWESGAIKTLEAENMLRICDALGIDPWWLVLGKGNFDPPITRGKPPLSNEAKKLVLWVERVDGLGEPASKFFLHIHAALQVAGAFTQVQNSSQDADLERAAADLPSLIGQPGGKERAPKKHQP